MANFCKQILHFSNLCIIGPVWWPTIINFSSTFASGSASWHVIPRISHQIGDIVLRSVARLNLCLLLLWIKYCRVSLVSFHLVSWTGELHILIVFLVATWSCLRCYLRWRSFQEFCWAASLLLIGWREGLLSLLLLLLWWTLRWWRLHIADLSRVWILVLGCTFVAIELS